MKNEKGFSLIVLVITIILIIILAMISMNGSTRVIDETDAGKKTVEASQDDQKIKEIITYEIAGTTELMDPNLVFMRLPLDTETKIKYKDVVYGIGFVLYLSDKDIGKVEAKTGTTGYYQSFKDITQSYVVDTQSGSYTRLESDSWEFVN